VWLALFQRFAGDAAGAKVTTAEAARNTFEQLYKDQSRNFVPNDGPCLSLAYVVMGEKDAALKEAQHLIVRYPSTKDAVNGAALEENLALIQTILGENSLATSTLAHVLQMPGSTYIYSTASITPALLRLDPLWDPLRSDPAFQKLCCEEKQP